MARLASLGLPIPANSARVRAGLGCLQCLNQLLFCDLRILDLQVLEPSEEVPLPPVLARLNGLDQDRFHDIDDGLVAPSDRRCSDSQQMVRSALANWVQAKQENRSQRDRSRFLVWSLSRCPMQECFFSSLDWPT